MSRIPRRRRSFAWLTAVGLAAAFPLLTGVGTAHAAPAHDTIQGTGSSWSANAVNQWVADVQQNGLRVVYTAPGSAQGRKDFASYNNDFGVSDIGYQGNDPKTGAEDSSSRPYAYLPIVAGGTAFPYQLKVAGKRITNLRLSGQTLAKIFTGSIKNWNDPAITRDNNGRRFPSKTIIPVVHSEGAGSTAQFTRYLAKQYGSIWAPFNGNPAFTEYYPAKGGIVAQSGSDGVMNYITSAAGDGTIGYDEYSYALASGFPVAKIENAAGYYTLPTQNNVAVALTQAQINMDKTSKDYLLQNLDKVYTYRDDRTYALSSYSYAIIPTANNDRRMTTAKRQTIADYLGYSVCGGQAEMGPIGYSALPLNLVTASFAQIGKLKTADPKVDLTQQTPSKCDNPTFDKRSPSKNRLAEIAVHPAACDKNGAGPCSAAGNDTGTTTGHGGRATGNAGGSGNGNGSGGRTGSRGSGTTNGTGGTSGTGGTAGTGTATGQARGAGASAAAGPAQVDPETGQLVNAASADGTGDGGAGGDVQPTDLAAYNSSGAATPYTVLAIVLLLVALVAPPVIALQLRSRKQAGQ